MVVVAVVVVVVVVVVTEYCYHRPLPLPLLLSLPPPLLLLPELATATATTTTATATITYYQYHYHCQRHCNDRLHRLSIKRITFIISLIVITRFLLQPLVLLLLPLPLLLLLLLLLLCYSPWCFGMSSPACCGVQGWRCVPRLPNAKCSHVNIVAGRLIAEGGNSHDASAKVERSSPLFTNFYAARAR